MNAKLLCMICVLTMVMTVFAACVPVSATSDSTTVNLNQIKTNSTHIQSNVITPYTLISSGACKYSAWSAPRTMGWDYTIQDGQGQPSRGEGMRVYNIKYTTSTGSHPIISQAYQTGIYYILWYGGYSYYQHLSSAIYCAYNYWSDSYGWHYNNVYYLNDLRSGEIQFKYSVEFDVNIDGSIQFNQHLSWSYLSSQHDYFPHEIQAFWKIEFLMNGASTYVYYDNGLITHNVALYPGSSHAEDFDASNSNVIMYTYGHATNAYDQEWAAFDTPLPNSYFNFYGNANNNIFSTPQGAEYFDLWVPTAGTDYYSWTSWQIWINE